MLLFRPAKLVRAWEGGVGLRRGQRANVALNITVGEVAGGGCRFDLHTIQRDILPSRASCGARRPALPCPSVEGGPTVRAGVHT